MSKQPSSKRQWRDGVSSAAKKPSKPAKSFANKKRQDNERKTSGKPYGQKVSDGPKAQNTTPKQRAAKAKKLVVRNPNQKIMEHARDLKERRSDLSRFEPERLQKVLAASGVGSRREMEEWISNGWVTVNGRVAQLGDKVTPDDHVTVKGSIIKLNGPTACHASSSTTNKKAKSFPATIRKAASASSTACRRPPAAAGWPSDAWTSIPAAF